jgi:hypothetical protein
MPGVRENHFLQVFTSVNMNLSHDTDLDNWNQLRQLSRFEI